jgi:hypothetical protein
MIGARRANALIEVKRGFLLCRHLRRAQHRFIAAAPSLLPPRTTRLVRGYCCRAMLSRIQPTGFIAPCLPTPSRTLPSCSPNRGLMSALPAKAVN